MEIKEIEYYGEKEDKKGYFEDCAIYLQQLWSPSLSEGTINYHPLLASYYILSLMSLFGDTNIYILLSQSLEGPWIKKHFFSLPFPFKDCKRVFCYAAKSHPQFSTKENEITFSFSCNTFDNSLLEENAWIYTPKLYSTTIEFVK